MTTAEGGDGFCDGAATTGGRGSGNWGVRCRGGRSPTWVQEEEN